MSKRVGAFQKRLTLFIAVYSLIKDLLNLLPSPCNNCKFKTTYTGIVPPGTTPIKRMLDATSHCS